jgi:hypothetical protein
MENEEITSQHNVFVQYHREQTITTHAFYDEQRYFENTNDDDNKCKVHKVRFYGQEKHFDTVGDFRWWLTCKTFELEQTNLFEE